MRDRDCVYASVQRVVGVGLQNLGTAGRCIACIVVYASLADMLDAVARCRCWSSLPPKDKGVYAMHAAGMVVPLKSSWGGRMEHTA